MDNRKSMQWLTKLLIFTIALSLLTFTLPAQTQVAAQGISGRKIKVVATVGMIGDLAKIIGGERVEVKSLMGPGVDPHLYRATAGDLQTLNQADIIFYNGLNLEGKMADVFEQLGRRRPTVAIAAGTPKEKLLTEADNANATDPHVWFDVTLWAGAATVIEKELAKLDSASAAGFADRNKALQAKLTQLDSYVGQAFQSVPEAQRVLITAHDAFNYYGKRYKLEVEGLQGISTEAEAGADDVRKLAEKIADRKIPAIFVESSVPRRNIEAVQEAVKSRGWNVKIGGQLFSDALGDEGTPEGTYIGMVLHNTVTIVAALGGKLPELPKGLAEYKPLVEKITGVPAAAPTAAATAAK